MTIPAVELRSVTKHYGAYTALRDVSLVVPQQSFFCLLGASGSGKSSALRIIAGLEQLSQGSLLINGVEMSSVPPHRRPVNTVFQSYALFPRMNLFDNVAYGLRASKLSRSEVQRRAEEALALVRMSAYSEKRPAQLSGGQQQRGALARALVNEPRVLLLDEPLGALDMQLRHEMQQELVRLHRRAEMAFIHVTHDQEEAFACATHVGIVHEGQILQIGSPIEIYRKPRTPFVADFVGAANLIPVKIIGTEPDGFVVQGPVGTARAGSWEQWQGGALATLVVRPEDIDVLDPTPQPSAGWAEGRLASRIVTGSTVRLTVEVGGTTLVVERSASPSGELAARLGGPVIVRVSREKGWLVKSETAAVASEPEIELERLNEAMEVAQRA